MAIGVARYRTTQTTTASRERLLVLLLERALRCIREGAETLEAGTIAGVDPVGPLTQASDIVVELMATLDRTKAPVLAGNLSDVYQFICRRLGQAAAGRDARAARDAERTLEPLVDGFSRVVASMEAR